MGIDIYNYILSPGRYVGVAEEEDDEMSFEQKMAELTKELSEQFTEAVRLEAQICQNLKVLGYEL